MTKAVLRALIKSPAGLDGELVCEQYRALAPQIPHLYVILASNALLLAATHLRTAPWELTLLLPLIFVLVSAIRIPLWWMRRNEVIDPPTARTRLRRTSLLAACFSLVVTCWSLSLYPYGDVFARCHVAFYMAITVISCIFCLRHAPQAAVLVTVIVTVPYTIFFLACGHVVLDAIAVNLVLVAGSILVALEAQFADFRALIDSRRALIDRQHQLERLSEENLRLANLDSLTALPNRRRFLEVLDQALDEARTHGRAFAVALVDVDGFKAINDVYGHSAGDRLLAEAGERLLALSHPDATFAGQATFAGKATFARLGGDEFGAILHSDPSPDDLLAFGGLLRDTLRGRYLAPDIAAEVTASVGIVAFPEGGETAAQLFERADFALYHAKSTDRGNVVLFSAEHERMIREASHLEHALRQIDFDAEMRLAFQPIVDARTRNVLGFEALARWTSPRLGNVAPDKFIQAAERIQLVSRLSQVLLAKALRAASGWPIETRIAFNLSALDLASPETIGAILRIVTESGIDPDRIDLEVTETAVMHDVGQAVASLAVLRRHGVRISLDDFGTGYSSLSHVHRLKPDKIKIDRSFVVDLLTSQTSRDIVRTTVELCRGLGITCVVEGVETEAQMRLLRSLGCELMQGYLFGRPSEKADLAERAGERGSEIAQAVA